MGFRGSKKHSTAQMAAEDCSKVALKLEVKFM
jgi:hypothetical protein